MVNAANEGVSLATQYAVKKPAVSVGKQLAMAFLALSPASAKNFGGQGRVADPALLPKDLRQPAKGFDFSGRDLVEIPNLNTRIVNEIELDQIYGVNVANRKIDVDAKVEFYVPDFSALAFNLATVDGSQSGITANFICPRGSEFDDSDCRQLNKEGGALIFMHAEEYGGQDLGFKMFSPGTYAMELTANINFENGVGFFQVQKLDRLEAAPGQIPPNQDAIINPGWPIFPGEQMNDVELDRTRACFLTFACEPQVLRFEVSGNKNVFEYGARLFSSDDYKTRPNELVSVLGEPGDLFMDETVPVTVGPDGEEKATFYNEYQVDAGPTNFCVSWSTDFGNDYFRDAQEMTVDVAVKRVDGPDCDEASEFSLTQQPTEAPVSPTPSPTESTVTTLSPTMIATPAPATPSPTDPTASTPMPVTLSPSSSPFSVSPTTSPTQETQTTEQPTASPGTQKPTSEQPPVDSEKPQGGGGGASSWSIVVPVIVAGAVGVGIGAYLQARRNQGDAEGSSSSSSSSSDSSSSSSSSRSGSSGGSPRAQATTQDHASQSQSSASIPLGGSSAQSIKGATQAQADDDTFYDIDLTLEADVEAAQVAQSTEAVFRPAPPSIIRP